MVNVLLAGFDVQEQKASVYWIDYLATSVETPFAAHGYAQYFVLSLLDRHYQPDLELEQVKDLAKMCAKEMLTRFVGKFSGWKCQVVDKDGVREEAFSV
jgi:20S proteasome subunit beta 4